jgi:hypothetical protein
MASAFRPLVITLLVTLAGCGTSVPANHDGGLDAGMDAGLDAGGCHVTASKWVYSVRQPDGTAPIEEERAFPPQCAADKTCECLLEHGKNKEDPCGVWRCETSATCELTLACVLVQPSNASTGCESAGTAGSCNGATCPAGCMCFALYGFAPDGGAETYCHCGDPCTTPPSCGSISCEAGCTCTDAQTGACACGQ